MIFIKKFFLFTPILMFIIACLFHFLYDWTNNFTLIALICPTNESIFEHTKLIFIPLLIFYLFFYFKNKKILNEDRYFFSMLISIVLGILSVPMLYYFYTESFGIQILFVDILITLISFILSNLLFYNYYKLHNFNIKKEISIFLLIFLYIFYIYASFNYIDLPIFNI